MSSSLVLPPKLRGNATVERVFASLQSARAKNKELREVAKDAVTPGRATLATQAGAAAHGAIEALVPEGYTLVGHLAAALALGLGGLYWDSPDAVLAANGILAPMTSRKTFELLTTARQQTTTEPPGE
jgi:hypothetical protein